MPRISKKINKSEKRRTVTDLLDIMARLRGPSGCPWDREQTPQTLKKFLVEEAYETLEAIEAGTAEALQEELGDLLLQIVFLSRMAEERGEFNFSDVVHTLVEKLIRRHPHVFAPAGGKPVVAKNPEDLVKIWRDAKESEGKYADRKSLLDGIPLSLPALERARRLSQRVSRVGLHQPEIESVRDRIHEGLASLGRTKRRSSQRAVEEMFGDLLFALVNWARLKDISAEEALRKANRRFSKRVRQKELQLRRRGKTLHPSIQDDMGYIWDTARDGGKKRRRAGR